MNYTSTIPSLLKCEHFRLFEISQPLVDDVRFNLKKSKLKRNVYHFSSPFRRMELEHSNDSEKYYFHRLIKTIHAPDTTWKWLELANLPSINLPKRVGQVLELQSPSPLASNTRKTRQRVTLKSKSCLDTLSYLLHFSTPNFEIHGVGAMTNRSLNENKSLARDIEKSRRFPR